MNERKQKYELPEWMLQKKEEVTLPVPDLGKYPVSDEELNELGYISAYSLKWKYGNGLRENAINRLMEEKGIEFKTYFPGTTEDIEKAYDADSAIAAVKLVAGSITMIGDTLAESPHFTRRFMIDHRTVRSTQ